MALAANALTTLATVKSELGITDSAQDSVLERAINGASAALERWCGRAFQQASVTEKLRGNWTRHLLLARTPVTEVTSVEIDGTALEADDYELEDAEAGILSRAAGWPAGGELVVGIALTPVPGTGTRNVKVVYVGGYVLPNDVGTVTLPPDLERACIETVKAMHAARTRDPAVASEQLGDYAVTYRADAPLVIPLSAQSLAEPFRRLA